MIGGNLKGEMVFNHEQKVMDVQALNHEQKVMDVQALITNKRQMFKHWIPVTWQGQENSVQFTI